MSRVSCVWVGAGQTGPSCISLRVLRPEVCHWHTLALGSPQFPLATGWGWAGSWDPGCPVLSLHVYSAHSQEPSLCSSAPTAPRLPQVVWGEGRVLGGESPLSVRDLFVGEAESVRFPGSVNTLKSLFEQIVICESRSP